MRRFASIVLPVVAACAFCAAPAFAQVDTSKPIPVQKTQQPKTKREVFKGAVMNATTAAITVRSRENERLIRTFSYSPAVSSKMQRIIDRGGYQYGDKVDIVTEAGSTVAIEIRGKPSKHS